MSTAPPGTSTRRSRPDSGRAAPARRSPSRARAAGRDRGPAACRRTAGPRARSSARARARRGTPSTRTPPSSPWTGTIRAATRAPSSAWARAKPSRSGGTSSAVAAVVPEPEVELGVRHRDLRDQVGDVRGLGRLALQELQPRRQVVAAGRRPRPWSRPARRPRSRRRTRAGLDHDPGRGEIAARRRVVSVIRDTLAIDGSASPRNPMRREPPQVVDAAQLRGRVALEREHGVAPRSSRSRRRTTRISARPPAVVSTVIVRAPASIALSTSSLTTDAGRSITSPAAI